MTNKATTVELGDEVECTVTGFRGVTTYMAQRLHGVDRYSVQPPVDRDGKVPDSYEIDVTSLRVLVKAKVKAHNPVKVNDIQLGDEVEDPVTGMKGVVTVTSLALNGCTRVIVQPKLDHEGKYRKAQGFDIGELKKVKTAAVDHGQKKTGGPMTRKRYGSLD